MKWKAIDRRTGLNLTGIMILLMGLVSAGWIYRTAENDARDVLGYEQGSESVYPLQPEDSKKYLRDLELYGGKANVLADEFRRWFVGLWHGKSLAFTVGCITIFIALSLFYAANHMLSGLKSNKRQDNSDRTD